MEIFEASGLKNVSGFDNGYWSGMGIHEMGTARMGRDPKTSVLNEHNQIWDAPNVLQLHNELKLHDENVDVLEFEIYNLNAEELIDHEMSFVLHKL